MNVNPQESQPNEENGTDSSNVSLHRYNFIHYLDTEINNIRNEIIRPGWTTHTILVSVAALTMTLLFCWEQGQYSLKYIAFLALGFSLLRDLLNNLIYPKRPLKLNIKIKRRFMNRNMLISNRLALILITIQYSFFLFIALTQSQELGTATTVFTSLFFSVLLLALLTTFLLFSFKFPLPMTPPRKKINLIFNIIILLSFFVIIFRYIGYPFTSSNPTIINDVRIALIIVALFFLLITLSRVPNGKLTLESLIITRRELAFHEIDLDTARIHTDIALTGLKTSDVLEEYLTALLSLYRDATIKIKEASRYLGDVEILYGKEQNKSAEQTTLTRPLLENVSKLTKESRDIIRVSIPKAWNRLNKRVIWISTQIEATDTLGEIDMKLEDAKKDLEKHSDTLADKLKTLMDLSS